MSGPEAKELAELAQARLTTSNWPAAQATALVAIALALTSGRPLQVEVRGDVNCWEAPA